MYKHSLLLITLLVSVTLTKGLNKEVSQLAAIRQVAQDTKQFSEILTDAYNSLSMKSLKALAEPAAAAGQGDQGSKPLPQEMLKEIEDTKKKVDESYKKREDDRVNHNKTEFQDHKKATQD